MSNVNRIAGLPLRMPAILVVATGVQAPLLLALQYVFLLAQRALLILFSNRAFHVLATENHAHFLEAELQTAHKEFRGYRSTDNYTQSCSEPWDTGGLISNIKRIACH